MLMRLGGACSREVTGTDPPTVARRGGGEFRSGGTFYSLSSDLFFRRLLPNNLRERPLKPLALRDSSQAKPLQGHRPSEVISSESARRACRTSFRIFFRALQRLDRMLVSVFPNAFAASQGLNPSRSTKRNVASWREGRVEAASRTTPTALF